MQRGSAAAGKQHWSVKAQQAKKNLAPPTYSSDEDDEYARFSDAKRRPDTAATPSSSSSSDSSLWVDNHKPTNIRDLIGQQGDKSGARKLYIWLSHWRDNYWKKPVCKFDSAGFGCAYSFNV